MTFPLRSQPKSSPRAEHGNNQKKRNNEKSQHGKGASKPQTLQAAVKLLSQETLEKALNQSKKAFPNSTLLWLKDLASFLNVHFEEVSVFATSNVILSRKQRFSIDLSIIALLSDKAGYMA